MTKRYIITAAVCLVMAMTAGAQTKELLILHSNDTHSCVDPLSVNVKEKGDVADEYFENATTPHWEFKDIWADD